MDEVRSDLFELVRLMNGFPYKDASLKRRLQTRKGDTVATKLAYDIHSLVSVIGAISVVQSSRMC